MRKDIVHSERSTTGKCRFIVYEAEDGRIKIDVRLEYDTVWLTQQLMAELFRSTKQNIWLQPKKIFREGELEENRAVKEYLTLASDGKNYRLQFRYLMQIQMTGRVPTCDALMMGEKL